MSVCAMVNNILATILGNLELARLDPDPSWLEEIQAAAERARDLIQRMLSYSHPHPASRLATPLVQPISEVCRILSAVIPSSIQLRLNLSEQAPPAQLDPVELHQILANLIINSRDELPEQGLIEVGLRYAQLESLVCSSCLHAVEGPLVEIWVRDSGPGIPAEIRSRIFDRFFTTKGVGKGSGLGLAVLHRLVHERGGHVVLGPGPGAHFRVLLQPAPNSPAPSPIAASRAEKSARIMVIDDEPMLARMLGKLLDSRGYQPEVFTDSKLAWEAFAAEPAAYAAVITDQTMPNKTGDVFARDALTLRPELPILLCTGFSERIDADRARAIGIRYFFQKPVKPATLFEALAQVVPASK
ncbi:MAG: response regulator [Candidatus Eremiobacteraeota bacterium]|nr:response regulator [Candidatus Eremiobacteraeota bacterium]MCW5868887.1 response regulator [Candidatus Eremiobacteraeota bacterium]